MTDCPFAGNNHCHWDPQRFQILLLGISRWQFKCFLGAEKDGTFQCTLTSTPLSHPLNSAPEFWFINLEVYDSAHCLISWFQQIHCNVGVLIKSGRCSFSLSPIFEALRLWGLPTWQINVQEKNIQLPVNYLKDLIWFPEWETDSVRGDQCPRPNSPRLVFERKSCCENKDWSRREQKNEKVQLLTILRSTLDSHWLNYFVILFVKLLRSCWIWCGSYSMWTNQTEQKVLTFVIKRQMPEKEQISKEKLLEI